MALLPSLDQKEIRMKIKYPHLQRSLLYTYIVQGDKRSQKYTSLLLVGLTSPPGKSREFQSKVRTNQGIKMTASISKSVTFISILYTP